MKSSFKSVKQNQLTVFHTNYNQHKQKLSNEKLFWFDKIKPIDCTLDDTFNTNHKNKNESKIWIWQNELTKIDSKQKKQYIQHTLNLQMIWFG